MVIREHIERRDPISGTTYVRDETAAPVSSADMAYRRSASANRLVWFLLELVNFLLLLRVVFRFLGARDVGFASFLYSLTNPLVAPFVGIFPAPSAGGAYIDTAAIVAMVVYALVAWAIVSLIDYSRRSVVP